MRLDPRLLLTLAALTLGDRARAQDDLTLFTGVFDTTTYLVDTDGSIVRSWPSPVIPGVSAYILPNGDLMRSLNLVGGPAGFGGGFEQISWDGTQVKWQYSFFTPTLSPHHDIEVMPNGNVLMIVWETLTAQEAIDQGRNPALVGTEFMPDRIIEVQQTGPTTGSIVWEWRAWDHLIQDFDSQRPNFGVVGDHPELIDLNYPPTNTADWLHVNSVDYNPELDQIALSTPTFNELWVIDHSTTTAEAAGHTGGNSGKGGDLLYRWGNPQAYDRGSAADQRIYVGHDFEWIPPGRPGEGSFLLFNNGQGRPEGPWSSVEEVVPPVDAQGNYTILPGQPFAPSDSQWEYNAPGSFYSAIISGSERLKNGNTLICEGTTGRLFEVTSAGQIVWSWINDHSPGMNWVFKARRYSDCSAGCPVEGGIFCLGQFCPCGNDDLSGSAGCATSAGSGASLTGEGASSVSADDLSLIVGNVPSPNANGIVFMGPTPVAPFQPASSDGYACTGGGLRFPGILDDNAPPNELVQANVVGTAAANAVIISPGEAWYFQGWFRDNNGSPCGGASNLSNGYSVTFSP